MPDACVVFEAHPLRWPDGQPRTRVQDRTDRKTWKATLAKARDGLQLELKRSGATSAEITYDLASLDPGVAVYFSRKAHNQFAWQEAFGFIGRVPSREEIEQAYRKLVRPIHPDNPVGADAELFRSLTMHRDRALDYISGKHKAEHEYVIAVDVFDSVRLNLYAVKVMLHSLRRIEDCGSPLMLERAFRGFRKQITSGEVEHEPVTADV